MKKNHNFSMALTVSHRKIHKRLIPVYFLAKANLYFIAWRQTLLSGNILVGPSPMTHGDTIREARHVV